MKFEITPKAVVKLVDLMRSDPDATWLRVGVRGGGCSGYQYSITFGVPRDTDKRFNFRVWEGEHSPSLDVCIDMISVMYLDGVSIDYVETLMESGFKFNNPNAKTTCGCGSSFGA